MLALLSRSAPVGQVNHGGGGAGVWGLVVVVPQSEVPPDLIGQLLLHTLLVEPRECARRQWEVEPRLSARSDIGCTQGRRKMCWNVEPDGSAQHCVRDPKKSLFRGNSPAQWERTRGRQCAPPRR